MKIQFENLVVSNKCKTRIPETEDNKAFENLVVSNKCKTQTSVYVARCPFENLVVSNKCKTIKIHTRHKTFV